MHTTTLFVLLLAALVPTVLSTPGKYYRGPQNKPRAAPYPTGTGTGGFLPTGTGILPTGTGIFPTGTAPPFSKFKIYA